MKPDIFDTLSKRIHIELNRAPAEPLSQEMFSLIFQKKIMLNIFNGLHAVHQTEFPLLTRALCQHSVSWLTVGVSGTQTLQSEWRANLRELNLHVRWTVRSTLGLSIRLMYKWAIVIIIITSNITIIIIIIGIIIGGIIAIGLIIIIVIIVRVWWSTNLKECYGRNLSTIKTGNEGG